MLESAIVLLTLLLAAGLLVRRSFRRLSGKETCCGSDPSQCRKLQGPEAGRSSDCGRLAPRRRGPQ